MCVCGSVIAADVPSTTDADTLSKARAVGTKSRAVKKYDTKESDPSGLPEYKPQQRVSGKIRQWADDYIKDSHLVEAWLRLGNSTKAAPACRSRQSTARATEAARLKSTRRKVLT